MSLASDRTALVGVSMGYTHYWADDDWREPIAATSLGIIWKLASRSYRAGIIQREKDDCRLPVITATELRFNGVGERGHEAFFFRADGPDPFGSCETDRKPYDGFVMRVLLVLASHRHGFTIMSDGAFDQEWGGALKWFDRTIGHPYR